MLNKKTEFGSSCFVGSII